MNINNIRGTLVPLLLLFFSCYGRQEEKESMPLRVSPQTILNFLQANIEPDLKTLVDTIANDADHATRISATGIGTIPTVISSVTTISTSGDYALGADITIALGDAITINANDVNLDLNGRTITGSTSATNGVVVNAGKSRVTIQNGTIRGMSNAGIYVQGSKCMVSNCEFDANRRGVLLLNSYESVIQNCQATSSIEQGFCLEGCLYTVITNCYALSTGAINGSVFGFIANGGTGNLFIDCIVDGVSTTSTGTTGRVAGFRLNNEIASEIVNCRAANVTAAAGSAVPFGINLEEVAAVNSVFDYNHAAGIEVNTSDWLVDKNGTKYLAIGALAGTPEVEVLTFTPGATTPLVSFATYTNTVNVNKVRWLMDPDGTKYLAIGGSSVGGFTVRILHFDPASGTPLTDFAPVAGYLTAGNLHAMSWLVDPDGTRYLATGSFNATNNFRVLKFDPVAGTLADLTPTAAVFSAGAAQIARAVTWLVNTDGTRYLAIGYNQTGGTAGRILKFDPVSGTPLANLSPAVTIADSGGSGTSAIFSLAWLVDPFNGNRYLATGNNGTGSGTGPESRIFLFNPVTPSLTDTGASYQYDNTTNGLLSVRWLMAGNNRYLAVGGAAGGTQTNGATVHVLLFDPVAATLTDLQPGVFYTPASKVDTVEWLWDGDPYLVMAGTVSTTAFNTRILKFTFAGTNNSAFDMVQENLVQSVSGGAGGIGYFGNTGAGQNLFIDNIAFANATNYSFTDVVTNNINNRQGT